jgi:hypothetical protein
MPAETGTLLPPRYGDVRPIARGGMGEIFRATDLELGREVAVKLLAERYSADADSRGRFRREALAAARLSGAPNVVTVFDVGEHNGRPLIVMEYFPGGSLEERIAGRPPGPVGEALEWVEEAALALDAAHAAGIVHRDVKPANLLLDDSGHVHVADFGIASAAGLASFTQTGTILGTAAYLSPEQARGERATAASDRYALAAVAWRLLAGRRPFESPSATEEAAAHAAASVPSVHAANPELPPFLDRVFERSLAKDPRARYSTSAELVGELRRALHEEAAETWAKPQPAPPARNAPRRPRRRAVPVVLLGALAAVGIGAAVLTAALAVGGGTPQVQTVVRTVTGPTETVRRTTTVQVSTPPAGPPAASGAALNAAGFAQLQAGDYAGALPLLQQAVRQLSGTGSTGEAYAEYNLAYATLALGHCTSVLDLLDRSQAVQGHRPEINRLRHDARRRCDRSDGQS